MTVLILRALLGVVGTEWNVYGGGGSWGCRGLQALPISVAGQGLQSDEGCGTMAALFCCPLPPLRCAHPAHLAPRLPACLPHCPTAPPCLCYRPRLPSRGL